MSEPIFLCKVSDLEETGAFGVSIDTDEGPLDVMLIKNPEASEGESQVLAYRNTCPHLSIPLELEEHQFLEHGNPSIILCSTHGARFQVEDGLCILGPCEGLSLSKIGITIQKNDIYLV